MKYDALLDAMRQQIANPARAVVNSESAFIKDRLNNAGEFQLARAYWNWLCCGRPDTLVFTSDPEFIDLQSLLDALDAQYAMPLSESSRFD